MPFLIQFIRRIAASYPRDVADEQLLTRFADSQDEKAFAGIVVRHGPLVLHVCRQILYDPHDVEDAFQATFLVLVKRVGSIRRPERLAGWLYGVAHRVATRVRARTARLRLHEKPAQGLEKKAACTEPTGPDESYLVHEEVNRLPDKFRQPIVLCYFQGMTREQAARQLGWTEGAIKGCLERGRELLRSRLLRHGAPLAGLFPTMVHGAELPAIPGPVLWSTVQAAGHFTKATTGISQSVLSVTEEVLTPMYSTKLIMTVTSVILLGAMIPGTWLFAHFGTPTDEAELPGENPVAIVQNKKTPAPADNPVAKELQPFQGVWSIGLCDTVNKTLYASNRELGKWRWTVKGDEIIWALKGEEWKLRLHVDSTQKPMQIDLTYLSGPFKGEKCLGIYERGGVDGKTLQIAIQDPGANVARPKVVLPWSSASDTALIFLRPTEPVDPVKELARLQGTWTFRLSQTDAWPNPIGKGPDKTGQGSERKWVVKGNGISWTNSDGQEVRASFTINPNKVPRQIDLTLLSGPNKGAKCIGVYEWLDNKEDFWLCMVDPGRNVARPKDISYSTNEGRSMIALDRYRTPAEKEQRLLQGAWKFAVCQSEWWPVNRPTTKAEFPQWRWTIKGNEMSWTGVSTGDAKVSFVVDPMKSPKQIDFTFLNGPHKGKRSLGVYQLKGGSLWVCVQDPGVKASRPADFSFGISEGRSLIILDPSENK